MKSKKILLVCLLLAILTMGVVSAEGDSDFNETLTTGIDDEVSIDASYDDEITSEDSGDLIASSENDVLKDDGPVSVDVIVDEEFSLDSVDDIAWIHLPVGADEGFASVHDEFGNNLFDSEVGSDSHWFADETDGHYICSIAPKDLDWSDVGEILTFSFSNDDIKVLGVYEFVKHFDGSAKLEPLFNRGDFDWWISEHEFHENDWSRLCDVWYNDNVNDGTITLKIEYDSDTWTDEKRIGDYIYWNLEDIDFIEECGDYKVSLIYSNDDLNVTLCKDRIFTLTELNYGTAGYVYIAYPFDVIRFYSEEDDECESTYIDVYVDGVIKLPSEENPFRWTLEDLRIDEGGEYPITIIAFRGDEAGYIEEFKYTLIVDENLYDVRLYSNELGVERWNMEEPVLYVVYPEGLDEHYAMKIYEDDELLFEFDVNSSRNWTLDQLGIDRNGGFNVRLYKYGDEEQIADTWLNVNGIISQDNFNYWISTHECKNEDESYISEVWINDVDEGILILSIENSAGDIQAYERSVEETDNVHWELQDLDIIDETGTYTVNLTYSNNGRNISLEENHIFQLTKLYYNICENVYAEYPFDVIRFYSEEDDEGEPEYDVKVYVEGDEKPFGEMNPYRWNLEDLEIGGADSYDITIQVYKEDVLVEEFSYTLNVFDDLDNILLYSDGLSVESWEIDEPILFLICPEEMEGQHVRMFIDDNYFDEFDAESIMSWTLEDLEIDHDGGYNIQLYDDDDEQITDAWINVWCIDESKFRTWIWGDEDGPLYNDVEDKVISVETPEGKEGNIIIIIDGEEVINWEIDEDNRYHEWTLEDLEMTDVKEYNITVKYLGDEEEEILTETTLNVLEYDYSTFRAILDKENEILKLYCSEEGTIRITVLKYDDEDEEGEPVFEDEFDIDSGDLNNWKEWNLEDLEFKYDDRYYEFCVSVLNDEDEEVYRYSKGYQVGIPEVEPWDDENTLYNDYEGAVIRVDVPDSAKQGILYLVMDETVKFTTKVFPGSSYEWNLKTLDISSGGDYDITLIFFDGNKNITLSEETLKVTEFNNDTFRSKFSYIGDTIYFSFFCCEDDDGIITVIIHGWDPDEEQEIVEEVNYTIDDTFKNKWTTINYGGLDRYDMGDEGYVEVKLNGEDKITEYSMEMMERASLLVSGFERNSDLNIELPHGDFLWIELPFGRSIENCTVNISCGDYVYFKKLSELGLYEWAGGYRYSVTLDDLDSFETLSDKDFISVTFIHNNGKLIDRRCIEKTDDELIIHTMDDQWEGIRIDLSCDNEDEEEEDEEDEGGEEDEDLDEFEVFAEIFVPPENNIADADILVSSGDKIIFSRTLADLSGTFDYDVGTYLYRIFINDLNLTGLADKDIVKVAFISDGKILAEESTIYCFDGENGSFHHYAEDLSFDVHYGPLDDPEFGMGEHDGTFIRLSIPDILNITEGTIEITLDDGTVLFSKSLSSFNDTSDIRYKVDYDDYGLGCEYIIMANETIYGNFPQNQNMTFSFKYGENSISRKGIRSGDNLVKIITPSDVLGIFDIVISEEVLVNGTDYAITIDGTVANRQSIYIDIGGGYFSVYVNGVRIEDLGRINRYDGETELYLFNLCSNNEGTQHLNIYLSDIGITENGVYDIRVTHTPEADGMKVYAETEVLSTNVTLASNVKANYENESVEWLTGYGVDPILMYLDTYYGDINATTGVITVLNSDNETILVKNIKNLTYESGRYLLKYSDFTNKNFGDKIAVKYSDGNERNGETSLDVLWRDIEPTDFNTTVIDDLDDYYGNFVNMNIPAVITTGQVIVTVKFKNNHNSSISNMNVTTDFDSHAAYTFNVADIHANYENGNFALSLSDLGFYEIDGDYEIDVKFTADGQNILNVSDNTFNVALSSDVIITINETSRYGLAQAFATIKIFEPMPAYGELYIDGVLYSHQTFEKGLITFVSSPNWASGIHTAEVKVFNSEFEQLLNSSTKEFEVLTKTDDVEVVVPEFIKENAMVDLQFIAPVNGTVLIRIDDGDARYINVSEGVNLIKLGVLGYGNHTIWMLYNETLADGSIAFYNNYLNIFAGDDGHWMNLPDPLVLNDDDTIKFNFGEGVEGNITISIDNGLIEKLIPLVNGSAEFKLDESLFDESNKYGKHTYNITYSGDAVHEELSRNGTFTVSYLFRDNLVKEGVPLSIYYLIIITLPSDANGIVYITLEGKTYNSTVSNGQAEFRIDQSLDMGEHDVVIKYDGDAKYPPSEYATVLNISYYGVFGEFNEGNRFVSLVLPANATGNLTVFNDNRGTRLYSKALVDGKAVIDLNELPVGIYELRAVYEGDDYDARPCNGYFKVMPYVYITQNATIEDDVTIFVDLDDSTGHILILRDGLSPVLEEIVNGVINYTFSTVGYVYGDHNVTFQYIGKSFDSDLFNELDPTTGRYMPINYNLHLLSQEVDVNKSLEGNKLIVNFSPDAHGTAILLVDGVEYQVEEIVNGQAIFDLSDVHGDVVLTVIYSGDGKYAPYIDEFYMSIKAPRIAASDLSVLYTANKVYSVTVYGSDGKVVKGVSVSFLINNKAYKTVKTNAKGVASVSITQAPGSYKVTVKALKVSTTKKITVKHILTLKKVKVKRSAKKLVIKATLKKVNGKYLKGKKITLKFNGKKFKAKTNKKGVAKFTVKSNVLKKLKVGKKVKYQATYLKDTVKKSVKVKK